MTVPRLFLISIVTILLFCGTFAQDPQPAWRNYNTDHGLPSSEVYVAMQDSKGYMWFGSDNGLSRFDGYTFQNYGSTEGLQNNVVFDLQEDDQGRIWMMTMSGNAYYQEQDSIYPFHYNDTIQLFSGQFSIGVHLYFDNADSSLYVTLKNLGILQIRADGTHRIFHSKNPVAMVVLELKEKVLYVFSEKGSELDNSSYQDSLGKKGLVLPIEFQREPVYQIYPKGNKEYQYPTLGMVKILNNGIIIFEYSRLLGLIQNNKIQWSREFKHDITSIYKDGKGNIFLCLNYGAGAAVYENLDLLGKGESRRLLSGISAINMTQDQAFGYWFTTSEKGVFYSPNLDVQIYDENSGLSNAYISSFEEKDDSTLFVGLRDGGIFMLNTRSHILEKLLTQKSHATDTRAGGGITDLFYDKNENVLWSGDYLSYFSGNSWKRFKYTNPYSSEEEYWPLKKIVNSKDNNRLWVTSWAGMAKLDHALKRLEFLSGFLNSKSRTFSGYEDKKGQLWVGREDGLWKLEADTLVRPEIMHPSFYHRIEAIQQLPDSTFVIGTKGRGIILWKNTRFTEITDADGLTSNMIENIYVDEKGVIWVGTLKGLNKVTTHPDGILSIKRITNDHGLPSNEINQVEVINDEVWVATTKGLVRFPYDLALNLVSDPPFFEKVLINDKMIAWKKTDLTFSYQQNNISFHFLTINYRQNGKIPYRYRLAPAQNDWKVTQNRMISFPALNNGDYSFEVQSQNEDGVWSESAIFTFKISPPWWETWWAISLAFLVVIVAGFAFYKNRTRHLKNEITLQKQLTEVERQALRSQMNPHFIFNALNAIQGYIAQGDKLAANRYLSRFSKLIRAALQHSRMTKIPLRDDLNNLKNYLELEQMRFNGSFDYLIHIANDINENDIFIPPMLVQPFVENAIIHGLAQIEGKGLVDIDFRLENAMLLVSVIDNGIGIESLKKLKAGIPSSHKSIGMSVTKRRLDMLDGKLGKGSIDVKELKDAQGKAIGTKVSLQIPLQE